MSCACSSDRLCGPCTRVLMDDLRVIAGTFGGMPFRTLFDELDVTMSKTDKIATMNVGNVTSGATEAPLMINEAASDAKNRLALCMKYVKMRMCQTYPHLEVNIGFSDVAGWLLLIPNLLTAHYDVRMLALRIRQVVANAQRVVDRPADRYYLGICGGRLVGSECGNSLYANEKTPTDVTCRVCGTSWDVQSRRQALLDRLADMVVTADDVDGWIMPNGYAIRKSTLRSWVHRGLLASRGKSGHRPPRTLYRMGDITEVVSRVDKQG